MLNTENLAPGTKEVLRYFSIKSRRLFKLHADGSLHFQEACDHSWHPARGLKQHPDKSVEQYIVHTRARVATLPEWAQEVTALPSEAELREWMTDGICPTPTGHDVEPDGYGPDGVPSWLLLLGLI